MLAGLGDAAAAQGGNCLTNPLDIWLTGALILDDKKPVNPLKWWLQEQCSSNTHWGLLQMALDVLSCPATSVDMELAFSFGRDYVSSKRHRLSPRSLSRARGMAVVFYSTNSMIKAGVLAKWKDGIQSAKKAKSKEKNNRKSIEIMNCADLTLPVPLVLAVGTACTSWAVPGAVSGASLEPKIRRYQDTAPVPRYPGTNGHLYPKRLKHQASAGTKAQTHATTDATVCMLPRVRWANCNHTSAPMAS
ncbi:hypothetical protein PSTG_11872 [Puccinia striiformis f. sp. tritici PST-78]|uniref:HAT C-terminal dimerisation domain-containing protein n=1 Tax=Puccinia striiformis f. sp. tritici PST-78 TaxID=1165861 RepID=A0A0L0V646_9BASI|nr:hypothetical protein PSTG_11872 [Puccinia striiformis f. sp. tritici PST-78]